MERLLITAIKNPLDPLRSRDIRYVDYKPGAPISTYLYPVNDDTDVVASVNGKIVEEVDAYVPCPGDNIVYCLRPKGGKVLRIVAMVVVMVIAYYTGQWYAGTSYWGAASSAGGWGWGAVAVSTTVATAGSIAVNAVFPLQLPKIDTSNLSDNDSPTYGWGVQNNPTIEGRVIPILYGSHKVTPQIISKHVTTINDKQYLNVLMAVSDHQVDSIEDIKINDSPISYYKDVSWSNRLGTLTQNAIVSWSGPNFGDTISDYPIGSKISSASWAIKQIPGNTNTGIGVAFSFPRGLYAVDLTSGNKISVSVDLAIQYRKVGSTTWLDFPINRRVTWIKGFSKSSGSTDTISIPSNVNVTYIDGYYRRGFHGTVSRRYEIGQDFVVSGNTVTWLTSLETLNAPKDWTINGYYYESGQTTVTDHRAVPLRRVFWAKNLDPGEYEVQTMFATVPTTENHAVTDTYLEFVSSLIPDDFSYPGISLLAVKALATDQLSGGLPKISCVAVRQTVTIYNPNTTTYEEKDANNVAWACADAILNTTYGGAEDIEFFDYDAFDSWATLCETNGWQCNIYIDTTRSLGETLSIIARLGRAIVIQRGTTWTCIIDKEDSPVQMFNVSNTIENTFKVNYLSLEDRANVIEVTYFDSSLNYERQMVEIRTTDFDTTTEPVRKTQVTLYGCVDRTKAIEYGKFTLACNKYLRKTVEFEVDIDAIGCMPGDIIWVQHDVPQWGYGSRVISATSTSVVIGRDVTLEPDKTYQIMVRHQDDDSIEERTVVAVTTETTTDLLSITEPWTKIPSADAIVSFGEINKVSKKYRVVSISKTQDFRRKITGAEYNEEVYGGVGEVPESIVDTSLESVANLTAIEGLRVTAEGKHKSIITLNWSGNAVAWNIFIREPGITEWSKVGYSTMPTYEIDYWAEVGHTYEVAVSATDYALDGVSQTITLVGIAAPASNITNFVATSLTGLVSFTWDAVDDANLAGYEIRVGNAWEQGNPIISFVTDTHASWQAPVSGTYTFWIKAITKAGHYSVDATSVTVNVTTIGLNVVLEGDEINSGLGTFENMCYIDNIPSMNLIAGLTDSDVPTTWTDQTNAQLTAYTGTADTTGNYISPVNDLGDTVDYTARVWSTFDSYVPSSVTDIELADRLDTTYPLDTDQSITSNAHSTLYVRTSDDNITWSDWTLADSLVSFSSRYWQSKSVCDVAVGNSSFTYTSLPYIIDVPDKDVKLYNQSIAATGTTFTLSSLGITILNDYQVGVTILGIGSFFSSVDKSTAGQFTVYVYDGTGTAVAGTVDLHIRGY